MSVIVKRLNGPWQTVQACNVTVLLHDSGLIDTVRRNWDAEHFPHLLDALEAAHALSLGEQDCGECGERILWTTSGFDGTDRWHHTASGRAYCYRNPGDEHVAYPEGGVPASLNTTERK